VVSFDWKTVLFNFVRSLTLRNITMPIDSCIITRWHHLSIFNSALRIAWYRLSAIWQVNGINSLGGVCTFWMLSCSLLLCLRDRKPSVSEAFYFRVCPSVSESVSLWVHASHKHLTAKTNEGNFTEFWSQNVFWIRRCTHYIFGSRGQRSRSQRTEA